MGCYPHLQARRISMSSLTEWKVPPANQPRQGDYAFDLDRALTSVVGLHSIIPSDASSAETLGTERAGNGVLIDDGVILTIGYLITEAETIWLHAWRIRRRQGRRPRRGRRRRRPHTIGREPDRRQAGIRRLLGILAE
jgi:hypothetical protein